MSNDQGDTKKPPDWEPVTTPAKTRGKKAYIALEARLQANEDKFENQLVAFDHFKIGNDRSLSDLKESTADIKKSNSDIQSQLAALIKSINSLLTGNSTLPDDIKAISEDIHEMKDNIKNESKERQLLDETIKNDLLSIRYEAQTNDKATDHLIDHKIKELRKSLATTRPTANTRTS
eukprot:scaffold176696_cov49-Attheya_sp.AAC.1